MKKYKKIITVIFIVIFITVFSYYNFFEYYNFHKENINIKNINLDNKNNLENFSLEKIKTLDNIQLYSTPNKELLSKITNIIENSKKEIFIEVYMLTEKRIQESLIKAHKKGIKIKIILERYPYMAYNINNKAYEKLEKAGIDIIWSDKKNYSLNHSKLLLIDDLSIISTGNLSYSTFTKNRDFFIFTSDENINSKLKQSFLNDYDGVKINIYDDNLIFSPNNSRIKFEKFFESANKNIKMYFQYMDDISLVNKLIEIKKEKNIDINIIIPETAKDDDNIKKLKNNGIKISILSKNKMHAKSILIDNKYLFIGSINFSEYSIDKNREIGILIKNTEIINTFLDIYKNDFN